MKAVALFFYLYSIVSILIYLIALPFLILLSFKAKYRESIPARFFLWRNPPLAGGGVWFHSCSFGEARAIRPIVEALPQHLLRMSTTTQSGRSVILGYTAQSRYLPFESLLFGWVRPQKVLVVMEAEFWYLLFALAQKKGAKTVLINARMSDRSFPKYRRMAWLYRAIFRHIDEVYAQTQLDSMRLKELGAQHVFVTGNIKLAQLPQPLKHYPKPEGLVVCAASTHEGEEALILDAFDSFVAHFSEAKLLIVPRHPERFDKVADMVAKKAKETGRSWHRFSDAETFESQMVLIDKMGLLVDMYALSDLVILGGSFVEVGGHNAAEAAQFGCRIISGPHYFNQRDIFEAVEGISVVEASSLPRRMASYGILKPTRLKNRVDLEPIIRSIEDVL